MRYLLVYETSFAILDYVTDDRSEAFGLLGYCAGQHWPVWLFDTHIPASGPYAPTNLIGRL